MNDDDSKRFEKFMNESQPVQEFFEWLPSSQLRIIASGLTRHRFTPWFIEQVPELIAIFSTAPDPERAEALADQFVADQYHDDFYKLQKGN